VPGANVPADEAGAVHKEMMSLQTRHLPTLMAGVALEVTVLLVVLPAAGAVRGAEVVGEEDVADGAAMLPRLRNLRIRFRI
jgi:hypothetical protein